MNFKHASLDINSLVATVRLDHQEVLNAISADMVRGLSAAFEIIADRKDEVRCVILTGAGRAFSAGANLQGGKEPNGLGQEDIKALETVFHPFLRRLRDLHCPLITSINGPAAGAGMSFALMGDIIVAARSAYFLQAFRHVGLVPDCGSTWLLPRLVGKARAIELSLLGERLPAQKALEWGLINRVVDDEELATETQKLATSLANGPTVTLSMIRKLYQQSHHNSYEEQLNLEAQMQRAAGMTEDFREGVTAFLEKRQARFRAR